MPLVQTQKMQLRDKGCKKKHHYSAVLRWPPVCRATGRRGSPSVLLAPAGPSDTSGPKRFARSRHPRGLGGVARARAGIPAGRWDSCVPRLPPRHQRVGWIDCTRAAPGYQSSRRAHNYAAFRVQYVELCIMALAVPRNLVLMPINL